jgi:hypothetical protein
VLALDEAVITATVAVLGDEHIYVVNDWELSFPQEQ